MAAGLGVACGAEPRGDHAIFLIAVDTLRADRISAYGYTGHETPAIDALARRGTRFANAHAASSWTVPSMAAVMSSRYPTELGLVEEPAAAGARFAPADKRVQHAFTPPHGVDMLAERLSRAGYYCAAFVDQPGLNTLDGFLQGFDEWHYPASRQVVVDHDPAEPLPAWNWARVLPAAHVADQRLVGRFERWLAGRGRGSMFVWIHLLTPHIPYLGRDGRGGPRPLAPSDRYDEEVRLVDAIVGRALAAIEQHVTASRVTIVLLSDHGEAFGEHGEYEHGQTLHAEVTRVPLIIVDPALPAGATYAGHVTHLDVMPTLLALAGVEAEGTLRGVDLLELVRGRDERPPIYAEGMLTGSSERSLIADGRKLLLDAQSQTAQLYDLASDPEEHTDRAAAEPQRTAALRAQLDALHRRLEQESLAQTPSVGASEAQVRALRALGYVEGETPPADEGPASAGPAAEGPERGNP